MDFVNNQVFEPQKQLGYEFADYVNGFSSSSKHYPQLLGNGNPGLCRLIEN